MLQPARPRRARLPAMLCLAALWCAPALACPSATMPAPALPRARLALAQGQELVVVTLGSSSTQGWMASDSAHTYPAVLQAELDAALPRAHVAVINRGIGGQDAPEEVARLMPDVVAIRPQLVIWQVGANGAMRGNDPAAFEAEVTEGVAALHAAGADVILMDNQRSPRILAAPEHAVIEAALAEAAASGGASLFARSRLMDQWQAEGAGLRAVRRRRRPASQRSRLFLRRQGAGRLDRGGARQAGGHGRSRQELVLCAHRSPDQAGRPAGHLIPAMIRLRRRLRARRPGAILPRSARCRSPARRGCSRRSAAR